MASVISRRVLEKLAEYLRTIVAPAIPAADVIVQDAGADAPACFPHLVIRRSGPFEFMPFEEDELWTTEAVDANPNTRTVQVGDISGEIEVMLGATNQVAREKLEDKILNAFLSATNQDEFVRPGVLVQHLDNFLIGDVVQIHTVPIGYVLKTELWNEEMVFEKKRFSSLMLEVDMPALVTRAAQYTIEELVICITSDLTSTTPSLSDTQVAVTEDGDLAAYTDPP